MTLHLLSLTLLLGGCDGLDSTTRLLSKAEAALDRGDLDQAEKLATEALDTQPPTTHVQKGRGQALYVMARVSWARGDIPEAVNLLMEAVEFHPELEPAYSLLGEGQRRLGLEDAAIHTFEHAVQLAPDSLAHRIDLCEVYLDLYQQSAARAACAEVLRRAPLDPRGLAADALLEARDGQVEEARKKAGAIVGLTEAQRDGLNSAIEVSAIEGPGRDGQRRVDQDPAPFFPARAAFRTTLTRHDHATSGPTDGDPLPADFAEMPYTTGQGELRGWVWAAPGEGPHPALLYLHSGRSADPAEVLTAEAWHEAGWLVYMPSFRGENGNPGDRELYLGEAEDAAAAARWLASWPNVDRTRIYAFGDAEGGVLAGLLGLWPDLPLVGTASLDGARPEQTFALIDPPFDRADPAERRARLWVHHLADLRRPHHAWVEESSPYRPFVEELRSDATAASAPLQVSVLPLGDGTARQRALEAWRGEIAQRGG